MPGLILATIITVPVVIIGAVMIVTGLRYKPRQFLYVSVPAYQEAMTNLEFLRRNAIEASESQVQIDEVNERYDAQEAQYRIKKGGRLWVKLLHG